MSQDIWTSIDDLLTSETTRDAFLEGKVRDETADIIIKNLGRALTNELRLLGDPTAVSGAFARVSGIDYGTSNSMLTFLFISMFQSGKQFVAMSPTNQSWAQLNRDAFFLRECGMIKTWYARAEQVFVPSTLLLKELAEKGWATPDCTRPNAPQKDPNPGAPRGP